MHLIYFKHQETLLLEYLFFYFCDAWNNDLSNNKLVNTYQEPQTLYMAAYLSKLQKLFTNQEMQPTRRQVFCPRINISVLDNLTLPHWFHSPLFLPAFCPRKLPQLIVSTPLHCLLSSRRCQPIVSGNSHGSWTQRENWAFIFLGPSSSRSTTSAGEPLTSTYGS